MRQLLWVNGGFNLLGAVLILAVSERVGPMLGVAREAAFLWNIIAASSFAFAVHSFAAARSREPGTIRVALITMLAFHASTAVAAVFALSAGMSRFVIINLAVHLLFGALFAGALLRKDSGLRART